MNVLHATLPPDDRSFIIAVTGTDDTLVLSTFEQELAKETRPYELTHPISSSTFRGRVDEQQGAFNIGRFATFVQVRCRGRYTDPGPVLSSKT